MQNLSRRKADGAALNQVKCLSCINGESYAPFVGARRVEAGAQAQGIDKPEQPSSTERGEASTRKPPTHSPEPPGFSLADRGHCKPPPTVLPVPSAQPVSA